MFSSREHLIKDNNGALWIRKARQKTNQMCNIPVLSISRQLASYCEHEDLERMEKGIYTDGFFNLTDDNIYKSKVIKDIDSNIEQLLKTDAKFRYPCQSIGERTSGTGKY